MRTRRRHSAHHLLLGLLLTLALVDALSGPFDSTGPELSVKPSLALFGPLISPNVASSPKLDAQSANNNHLSSLLHLTKQAANYSSSVENSTESVKGEFDTDKNNNTHHRHHFYQLTSRPTLFGKMFPANESTCQSNCSGHGDCYNGTCFCEVEYSGGTCNDPNFKYYISFSTVYYMICVVSFIQLMLCINSEIARQKPRSITRAFRINIQKALYFLICIGTAIRGFYFSSPANGHIRWAESLMSAYYPILMSGSSLLVCFWAEVFHLDVSVERSRFLSKSFTGFILFNVVSYSLLLAELVLLTFANPTDTDKGFFLSIFNSIYAFLMLIVVVFFLIYGVEVYFKVRGAFIQEESCPADISQLQQSRLGLVSQAVLLLITILFMISEVFGFLWKDKVPVLSRNYHQVMFRVVEFGVALWFPCVLWNCIQPERLWILNPRRILKRKSNFFQIDDHSKSFCRSAAESEFLVGGKVNYDEPSTSKGVVASFPECWICYESPETKPEAGPLIQPCACRGDVSAVHHSCLLRWLMESYSSPTCAVFCKVCGSPYRVEHSSETVWLPAGLTITHWFKTAAIVTIMCTTLAGSCMLVKLFEHMYVKTISVGSAILVEYICLRLLGFNIISAYHRAKFSAIKIIGKRINYDGSGGGGTNQNRPGDNNNSNAGDGGGKSRLARPPAVASQSSSREFALDTTPEVANEQSGHVTQQVQIERQWSEEERLSLNTLSEAIPEQGAEQLCSAVNCAHYR